MDAPDKSVAVKAMHLQHPAPRSSLSGLWNIVAALSDTYLPGANTRSPIYLCEQGKDDLQHISYLPRVCQGSTTYLGDTHYLPLHLSLQR